MTEQKMRYSRQRERIYEYLCGSVEHPSADMIYDDLRREMPNLSLGTVYRNLKQLEDMHMVQRITTPQNVERYDARCDDHAHFVCDRCGRVYDLQAVDRQAVASACGVADMGEMRWLYVTFGGRCAGCAEESDSHEN